MSIHRHEIIEPEELIQLGAVFDETWAALRASASETEENRAALAAIVLRLAYLSQLGPDQMKATAIRLFRAETPVARGAGNTEASCPAGAASPPGPWT